MEIRQTVVIVDLSGRCNQLIARSVRNLNVYCRKFVQIILINYDIKYNECLYQMACKKMQKTKIFLAYI